MYTFVADAFHHPFPPILFAVPALSFTLTISATVMFLCCRMKINFVFILFPKGAFVLFVST